MYSQYFEGKKSNCLKLSGNLDELAIKQNYLLHNNINNMYFIL